MPVQLTNVSQVTKRSSTPDVCVSYPLLNRVFVVVLCHRVLLRSFVLELKNGVDQHQDAQRQDAGDDYSDGVDRRGDVVEGHHDVHVVMVQLAVSTVVAGALHVRLEAAHPVT